MLRVSDVASKRTLIRVEPGTSDAKIRIALAAPSAPTSRGFLPWRLSDTGQVRLVAVVMGRHPKPSQRHLGERPCRQLKGAPASTGVAIGAAVFDPERLSMKHSVLTHVGKDGFGHDARSDCDGRAAAEVADEEKVRIMSEALAPGATASAVADRNGVCRSLLYAWLRLARRGELAGISLSSPKAAAAMRFAAVEIAGPRPPAVAHEPVAQTPAKTPATLTACAPVSGRRRST